jgi:LPXTG-motif cell wall-anchored protein
MVDNEDYFKLGKKIYRKDDAETIKLEASNYRRANLNITKVVKPKTAPKDAKFKYKVKVTDADSLDGKVWFSAYDPTPDAIIMNWNVEGAREEIDKTTGKPTGYWYAENGSEVTFSIKAGQNVRFLNLKHDSTFSIEETDPGDDFTFEKVEAEAQYKLIDNTDWSDYEVEGKKITGTITEPNNSYTVTYTNEWKTIDIQLKKVDEKEAALSGSSFDLTRLDGTTWTNFNKDIKPGDTATQTSNPVDLGKLGVGRYRLEETNAPDGYNIISKFTYFEVYIDKNDNDVMKARFTNEAGTAIDPPEGASIEASGTAEAPVYTITIANTPGTPLPHTGGIGTMIFYVLGSILAIGFAVILISRKRIRKI